VRHIIHNDYVRRRIFAIVLSGMLGSANEIADDPYALYSSILRGNATCVPFEDGEVAAISLRTSAPSEWTLKELKPSTQEEQAMVEEFKRLNSTKHGWKRQFDLGRRYRLLDERQAQVAGRCMFREEFGQARCAPYIGMVWVRSLSIPAFNRVHTRALVWIHNGREGWGGGSELAEYRKIAGEWRRVTDTFVPGHCIKY